MKISNCTSLILALPLIFCLTSCSKGQKTEGIVKQDTRDKIMKSDKEWKNVLTTEEYNVLRKKGTEPAFTGKYWDTHEPGVYYCAACHQKIFDAKAKFDSGTGWPSFYEPIDNDNVEIKKDGSLGMVRDEVVCSRCGGHLGHVFRDGPEPTGLRYCVNSVALDFEAE